MKKPGPSREYRELLKGRISPDEYVQKVKKQVDERRKLDEQSQVPAERRVAAS